MKTKQDLLEFMAAKGACLPATDYVMTHRSSSALTITLDCDRPDWLVWLLSRYSPRSLDAFAYRCADRAVRVYAPKALDRAGLGEHASALRSLPEIVDRASARAGFQAAARAARAAGAAEAAARAAWAAEAAEADWAAEAAGRAAGAAEWAAERAQQLTELRQIVKEVLK